MANQVWGRDQSQMHVGNICATSPLGMAAGTDELPAFSRISRTLAAAGKNYEARRFKSEGDWSDFAQTIALRNVPFGGKLYRINAESGNVQVSLETGED